MRADSSTEDRPSTTTLSGPDHQQVPRLDFLHGNLHLLAVPEDTGGLGGQVHQAGDGLGGLALGAGFQKFTQGNESQDHTGGLKIQVHVIFFDFGPVPVAQPEPNLEDGENAVDHRRRGPHGNKRIHIGCALEEGFEAHFKIFVVDIEDRQGQQELDEGKRKGVFPAEQEAGQGSAQHVAHGDIEQGQKEAEGSGHPPLHGLQLTGHRVLPDGGGSGLLGAGGPGRVARLTDGGRDALRRQDTLVVFHLHTVGQQVHLHGPHALQLAHGLFHVSGAGGAGHTSYVKFLFHRIHLTDTPLGWGGFIIAQGEGSVKIQDRFQIQL